MGASQIREINFHFEGGATTTLSNDINVITAEINAYKQVAGEAIFEIGRRLKHVKENDLAHGEFGKWLESVEIDRTLATRLMKIATEFDPKYATSHNLGVSVLYEIATLPPDQRSYRFHIIKRYQRHYRRNQRLSTSSRRGYFRDRTEIEAC